jgi:hypothetical protein
LTLASASGGKCSFMEPSDVLTSIQPFLASTLVPDPPWCGGPSSRRQASEFARRPGLYLAGADPW